MEEASARAADYADLITRISLPRRQSSTTFGITGRWVKRDTWPRAALRFLLYDTGSGVRKAASDDQLCALEIDAAQAQGTHLTAAASSDHREPEEQAPVWVLPGRAE
jgi:hypothetical protein